jgi:two-component system sensor histidine kinase MprB
VTFRLRLAIASAVAVAATIAIASAVVYIVMRDHLRASVDRQLQQEVAQVDPGKLRRAFGGPDAGPGGYTYQPAGPSVTALYMQIVRDDGRHLLANGEKMPVPVTDTTVAVAAGQHTAFFADGEVGHHQTRIYTVYVGSTIDGHGLAVQFVRPLDDLNRTLNRLRLILLLIVGGGIAVGAAAGALVSRAALVPVRRLTSAAERIAKTGDPSERVTDAGGRDELARLGTAFNTMLAALEDSLETQRRFVADASHELRTPLTSLQTNIEVLKQQERLAPGQRAKLFADLEREAHEMRDLIAALLELARGDAPQARVEVQLDEIVDEAVERARTRFPNVTFESTVEPTAIEGVPERLERAVWNLLENAGKWTAPGSKVEVSLENGEVRVRDHGPGIAAEDREHVFDRFYRAASARALPGSGLGLAIVRDVAEAHGGSVSAEDAPGGGALLRLRLASS